MLRIIPCTSASTIWYCRFVFFSFLKVDLGDLLAQSILTNQSNFTEESRHFEQTQYRRTCRQLTYLNAEHLWPSKTIIFILWARFLLAISYIKIKSIRAEKWKNMTIKMKLSVSTTFRRWTSFFFIISSATNSFFLRSTLGRYGKISTCPSVVSCVKFHAYSFVVNLVCTCEVSC